MTATTTIIEPGAVRADVDKDPDGGFGVEPWREAHF
jgi:hypothetical protein